MSQFVVFQNTGGGGTGPLQTLTGNDATIVPPTVAGHTINVVGDGVTVSTSGNAGTSTLLITLNNTTSTTLTTNDGAFHTIIPFALAGTGEAVSVSGNIIGTRFDGGNVYTAVCGGPFSFIASNTVGSGVAVLNIQNVATQYENSSTGNAAYQVVAGGGLNININVRGEAGQTWHWNALVNFVSL